jgi:hypothetical protein
VTFEELFFSSQRCISLTHAAHCSFSRPSFTDLEVHGIAEYEAGFVSSFCCDFSIGHFAVFVFAFAFASAMLANYVVAYRRGGHRRHSPDDLRCPPTDAAPPPFKLAAPPTQGTARDAPAEHRPPLFDCRRRRRRRRLLHAECANVDLEIAACVDIDIDIDSTDRYYVHSARIAIAIAIAIAFDFDFDFGVHSASNANTKKKHYLHPAGHSLPLRLSEVLNRSSSIALDALTANLFSVQKLSINSVYVRLTPAEGGQPFRGDDVAPLRGAERRGGMCGGRCLRREDDAVLLSAAALLIHIQNINALSIFVKHPCHV